ncbi:MAG: alkaline phosphatase [Rikenellaceae bacterium]
MKQLFKLLSLSLLAAFAISCAGSGANNSSSSAATAGKQAKYIFYFIGDGMTAAQVQLAEAALTSSAFRENYAKQTSSVATPEELFIKSLNIVGLATSNAANRYITDSAAAGTALATGSKTDVGMIGLDPEGNKLESVAYAAKKKGMKVGVVSSVSIDHATPASFYAHNASRSNYAEISEQVLTSGFDYFAGGSPRWDKRAAAEETDMATAYSSFRSRAEELGFKFVATKAEFEAITDGSSRVIATLDMLANEQYTGDGSALPYTIDLSRQESDDNKITLAQFTQKGIEVLDNEDGFFMMVEGGKIDWACHANDAATCAYEVVAFDEAVGVAMAFAAQHPTETLIVVTGDHDCGGLALGFGGTGYESAFDLLASNASSYLLFSEAAEAKMKAGETFAQLLSFACQEFGFTDEVKGETQNKVAQSSELSDFEVKLLRDAYNKSKKQLQQVALSDEDVYFYRYGGYDPFTTTCTSLINNKAGLSFSSFTHTAVPVMVFAQGASSEIFSGYYDNTDIAKKIREAGRM